MLVYFGAAVWDGRKKTNIRLTVPKEAVLEFIRIMRYKVECSPISIDCRTITRLPRTNFDHARNDSYSLAAKHLTETPFLGDFPYCDLALEAYMRDVARS